MSQSKELVKAEEPPKWDSIEEMVEYFNENINAAMISLTRIMWEVGRAGHELCNEAKYGDGAIPKLAEGIKKGTSWVYECIHMYEAYTWDDVKHKFLDKGIPASTIVRIGAIKDEGTRNYVEDKLLSGEITYEDISKAKKEYTSVVNNPEVSHSEIGNGEEPTIAERNASGQLPDDDPDNIAAAIIRSHFGKLKRMAEEQMSLMEDTLVAHDKLGDISDESLYELSQDRIVSAGVVLKKQIMYIENIVDTIKKLAPQEFEES